MTTSNVVYRWVQFYPGAPWQIVKWFTRDGRELIKGLDWGSEGKAEDFQNIYNIGPEIEIPDPIVDLK